MRCINTLSGILNTRIAGLTLEHPVLNASGILGSDPEHIDILASHGFSAIVTKTFTLNPREGYNPPILVELRSGGFLNAIGLANPGIQGIKPLVDRAKLLGKPIIISISGNSIEEFTKIAEVAEDSGASAVELNLSCPHVKGLGLELGSDPFTVFLVTREVSSILKIPVIVKLGLSDRIIESAGKALEAGARALTLINTIRALAIDIYSFKPILSNIYGGLSGPPIKPIALRVVYDVYREHRAEIIGCGGISNWTDAAEFILAGARAIQVGSAFLKNRKVVYEILEGIKKWMNVLGYSSVESLIGRSHV
jgi:dihydroorotate dehydrogenase (NAD+) catalytic subunit